MAALVGNDKLKNRLAEIIDNNKAPHAILISGEDGCGRNLLSRLVARALLEDSTDLVGRAVHPDCVMIQGEGASGMIPIRRVREASFELNKSAVMTQNKRVAIICDAGNLNKSSSNALLKIIEQPPQGVAFLLTAQSDSDLIDTILSRCVRFRVLPLSVHQCLEYTKNLYPSFDEARLLELCGLYDGRVGLIKQVLSTPERLSICDSAVRLSEFALKMDKLGMLSTLDCVKTKQEYQMLLFDLSMCIRRELNRDFSAEPILNALENSVLIATADIDKNINLKLLCTQLVARL